MQSETESRLARRHSDPIAMLREPSDVIGTVRFGAAGPKQRAGIDVEELGVTLERKGLLDRIRDHDEMSARTIRSDTFQTPRKFIRSNKEIADKDRLTALRQRLIDGKIRMTLLWDLPVGDDQRFGKPLDNVACGDRPTGAPAMK